MCHTTKDGVNNLMNKTKSKHTQFGCNSLKPHIFCSSVHQKVHQLIRPHPTGGKSAAPIPSLNKLNLIGTSSARKSANVDIAGVQNRPWDLTIYSLNFDSRNCMSLTFYIEAEYFKLDVYLFRPNAIAIQGQLCTDGNLQTIAAV